MFVMFCVFVQLKCLWIFLTYWMCSSLALIATSMMDDSCRLASVSHLPRKCTPLCQLMVIKLIRILFLTDPQPWRAATIWNTKRLIFLNVGREWWLLVFFGSFSSCEQSCVILERWPFFQPVTPGVSKSLKYSLSSGLLSLAEIMWGSLAVWQEQIIAWKKCCRV